MRIDPRTPVRPEDRLALELNDLSRRLRDLERPTGSQANNNADRIRRQLAEMLQMRTVVDTGGDVTIADVPADGTLRYFTTGAAQPEATELLIDCPTGKMIVTGSVSEASITPPGGFCTVELSVWVSDANGVNLPVGTAGCLARRYTNEREATNLRTNDGLVIIDDPVLNPGPYRVRMLVGVSGDAGSPGTVTCSIVAPTVTARVIGGTE